MAQDTSGSATHQNGAEHASGPEADPAEETIIEEASVIHLLRVLVAEAAPPAKVSEDAMDHDSPVAVQATDVNDITCEEAGCLLWDMSASRPVARVMLRNRALEALEIVIARELQVCADKPDVALRPAVAHATSPTAGEGSASPDERRAAQQQQQREQQRRRPPVQNALRILEICLGTLANVIVTQPTAAAAVSNRPELLALLFVPRSLYDAGANGSPTSLYGALYVDDARVLSELFRLFSLALRCQGSDVWRRELSSPAVLQRVMWVGAATADEQLFARFLDMLVALLHATSASVAEVATAAEAARSEGTTEPQAPAAAPPENLAAAEAAAAAEPAGVLTPMFASGRSCCRMLLECGLLEVLHQILLQALRACLPVEEKYSELGGGGDAGLYGSAADSDQRTTGASPPSVASGPAAAACGGLAAAVAAATAAAAGAGRGCSDSGAVAAGAAAAAAAEITPRSDASWRCGLPPDAATAVPGPGPEAGRRRSAGGTDGCASPAVTAAAAAVTAAAAAGGPVPLSEEALDAALRLIEELMSPSGPLASPGSAAESHGDGDGGSRAVAGGASGAEVLLQLHAAQGLRPALLQLLLGLLRYHYDNMQVVEGLLVVLVDLGPAVQEALAASPPGQATAVAARLVELLQDSCYSPADAAQSSVVQLQQGAWYLLAATLRGSLAGAMTAAPATAAAAAEASPAPTPATRKPEPAGAGPAAGMGATGVRAPASGPAAMRAAWRENWQSVARSLETLPELPRPEGCLRYARACCVAGLRLLQEVWDFQLVAADTGGDGDGDYGDDGDGGGDGGGVGHKRGGQRATEVKGPSGSAADAGVLGSADVWEEEEKEEEEKQERPGAEGGSANGTAESLAWLGNTLQVMLAALD